mmetsp:Transcript_2114/g.5313  ORF Transcript_2114/g.5313 Transcript_2114/m.5313 type:complete len:233 (-) Transcript_2114:776-1474(-)
MEILLHNLQRAVVGRSAPRRIIDQWAPLLCVHEQVHNFHRVAQIHSISTRLHGQRLGQEGQGLRVLLLCDEQIRRMSGLLAKERRVPAHGLQHQPVGFIVMLGSIGIILDDQVALRQGVEHLRPHHEVLGLSLDLHPERLLHDGSAPVELRHGAISVGVRCRELADVPEVEPIEPALVGCGGLGHALEVDESLVDPPEGLQGPSQISVEGLEKLRGLLCIVRAVQLQVVQHL